MLTRRLIPSMLLSSGRLVKGTRFRDYQDAGNPKTTARAHNAQGADELVLLDIEAARLGRGPDLPTIRTVAAECFMPLTVGGGIRSVEDARDCMDAGADKISVTSGALDDPDLITRLAKVYGAQAVQLGVDITDDGGTPRLYDHRHEKNLPDPMDWIRRGVALGAGEVRLTAVHREGTRTGMDLDLLARVQALVNVPVILEGGAGDLGHLGAAMEAGADGVAVGTMLVFSDNNLVKIKSFLAAEGHDMRAA